MSRTVEAAGAIPYRWRTSFQGWMKFSDDGRAAPGASPRSDLDELELCLVHRPKYDDWSWPKGKLENRETHLRAAVREVGEETGCLVHLGPYLGDAEYPLNNEGRRRGGKGGRLKHICYWMATPTDSEHAAGQSALLGPIHRPDSREVDQIRWVGASEARKLLTHPSDRTILDAFVDRVEQGGIRARQLIIVRHGKAIARKEWTGKDANRPLTPRGAGTSYALARELACFAPDRLLSSPWIRCVQTLRPYADEVGLPLEMVACLTESSYHRRPEQAHSWLDRQMADLLTGNRTTMICMHRPVLGGIFEKLRGLCSSGSLSKRLPDDSPFMPTGNAVVLSLTGDPNHPTIIDIQKVTPIVY